MSFNLIYKGSVLPSVREDLSLTSIARGNHPQGLTGYEYRHWFLHRQYSQLLDSQSKAGQPQYLQISAAQYSQGYAQESIFKGPELPFDVETNK